VNERSLPQYRHGVLEALVNLAMAANAATGDDPEGTHPLLSHVDSLLQILVSACVDTFATIRQLAIHGLAEMLSSGLLTDDQVCRAAASRVLCAGWEGCTQVSGIGLCMQKRTAFGEYRTAVMHEEDLYVRCGGRDSQGRGRARAWRLGARQGRRQAAHAAFDLLMMAS
jgi:hypothetical protein